MRTEILGVPFDTMSLKECADEIEKIIKKNEWTNRFVFTPNPEIVMLAQQDSEFMSILRTGDFIVPDGIGVVLASRLKKVRVTERVPGYDLALELMKRSDPSNPTKVYLFGAALGVAEMAKEKLEQAYSVNVVGTADGYFKSKKEEEIVEEINSLKPDILIVGLGMGRQEKWIAHHKNMAVKVSFGLGGAIDGYAGVVPRAPEFWCRIGLEWFYRALRQPSRFKRLLAIPAFIWRVLFCDKKN